LCGILCRAYCSAYVYGACSVLDSQVLVSFRVNFVYCTKLKLLGRLLGQIQSRGPVLWSWRKLHGALGYLWAPNTRSRTWLLARRALRYQLSLGGVTSPWTVSASCKSGHSLTSTECGRCSTAILAMGLRVSRMRATALGTTGVCHNAQQFHWRERQEVALDQGSFSLSLTFKLMFYYLLNYS
jgi:hypothetical protein